jgi:hypothetical protein
MRRCSKPAHRYLAAQRHGRRGRVEHACAGACSRSLTVRKPNHADRRTAARRRHHTLRRWRHSLVTAASLSVIDGAVTRNALSKSRSWISRMARRLAPSALLLAPRPSDPSAAAAVVRSDADAAAVVVVGGDTQLLCNCHRCCCSFRSRRSIRALLFMACR